MMRGQANQAAPAAPSDTSLTLRTSELGVPPAPRRIYPVEINGQARDIEAASPEEAARKAYTQFQLEQRRAGGANARPSFEEFDAAARGAGSGRPSTADELLAEPPPQGGIGATIQRYIDEYAVPTGSALGGIAGTILGGGLTAGAAALPSAAAGAGLGGAAGRVLPEITRPFLTGQPSEAPTRTALQAAKTGALEGAAQVVGGRVGDAVGRVLRPFANRVVPFARDVVKPAMERAGHRLSPGMMTESRIVDTLENIADSSLLGGGRVEALRKGVTEQGVRALTDELVDAVGTKLPTEEVVSLLTRSRDTARAMAHVIKRTLYGQVDDLARNVFVDMRPLWSEIREGIGFRGRQNMEKALSAAGVDPERFFQMAQAGGQTIPETSFALAQSARSRLLAVSRKSAVTLEDEGVRKVAGYLAGLIDQQMTTAARRLSPDALSVWRRANAFTARAAAQFDDRLTRRVMARLAQEPARVDALLSGGDKVAVLKRVQQTVGAGAFRELQGRLTETLIRRAADPSTNIINGRGLLAAIKGLGDEGASLVLGPNRARVVQFAQIVDYVQQRQGVNTGKVMIQLAQAPAAFQILRQPVGALSGAAYVVLIGPSALARLLTNPTGAKWLSEGLRTPEALASGATAVQRALVPFAAEPARRGAVGQ